MLKRLREAQGLTQAALAKKAKVQQSYIAMLESGARTNPSLDKLQRLAKVLKVRAADLVGGDRPRTGPSLKLDLPPALLERIQAEARRRGRTLNEQLLHDLSRALHVPKATRRRR